MEFTGIFSSIVNVLAQANSAAQDMGALNWLTTNSLPAVFLCSQF